VITRNNQKTIENMATADQRLDVTHLSQAIEVLERPMLHPKEQVQQAQSYVDQFKIQNANRLHMFFLTFYEFAETQHQHKFWTLSAIIDVLNASVQCRL